MATIINNPQVSPEKPNSSMSLIFGIVVLIVFVWLFLAYIVPAMQHLQIGTPQIQVPVQMPSKIDVNIVQPTK